MGLQITNDTAGEILPKILSCSAEAISFVKRNGAQVRRNSGMRRTDDSQSRRGTNRLKGRNKKERERVVRST